MKPNIEFEILTRKRYYKEQEWLGSYSYRSKRIRIYLFSFYDMMQEEEFDIDDIIEMLVDVIEHECIHALIDRFGYHSAKRMEEEEKIINKIQQKLR